MNWRTKLDRTRITVDDDTRRRHLDVLEAAIADRVPHPRPGRALVVAVALVLTIPVMAVAADNAAPGDFLYPVRQWFQPYSNQVAESHDTANGMTRNPSPGDNPAPVQPEVPERPEDTRPPPPESPDTRPPVREPTTTTVPVRRSPSTTLEDRTSTTEPERTPPTKPPRGS